MASGLVSPEESQAVRDGLLSIGAWQIGPAIEPNKNGVVDFADITTFASGSPANNRLVADMPLQEHTQDMYVRKAEFLTVRNQVLSSLGSLLGAYGEMPDTLWGLPSGGQGYAERLAGMFDLQLVNLSKVRDEPGIKTYRPSTQDDAEKLQEAKYMIGYDDVGNDATSVHGALYESDDNGLAGLRKKTIGFNFLWVRGWLDRLRRPDRPPLRHVVQERIPDQIRSSDSFYIRFGRLAVPVNPS